MLHTFQNALASNSVPAVAALDAKVIRDSARQPLVIAGDNALVARLLRTDGSNTALRILSSPHKSRDWGVRYEALAAYQQTACSPRLPLWFDVFRNALPNSGEATRESTTVAMEWISGPTLDTAVDRAVRTGNAAVLKALQAGLVRLWNDLVLLEFTHADFAPSNIIVRSNGHLACVDLDGSSWPGAPFAPSGAGTPAYRHPTHGLQADIRDAFGMLTLAASLSALADDFTLRPNTPGTTVEGNEALLFTSWDLAHAATSRHFAEVLQRVTPPTAAIIHGLVSACTGSFDEVLRGLAAIPEVRLPGGAARRIANSAGSWTALSTRSHIHSQNDSLPRDRIVTTIAPRGETQIDGDRLGLASDMWPGWHETGPDPHLISATNIVEELTSAIARSDETEVMRIWDLARDNPLSSLLTAEVENFLGASYDRRVLDHLKHQQDDRIVALGREAEIRQIPLGPRARTAVRQARERIDVRARLDQALASDDRRTIASMAISGELVVLGETDRASIERVIQAIEWPVLERAIAADDDVLIDVAFDDDLFNHEHTVTDSVLQRVRLARQRLAWLGEVRNALVQRQIVRLGELFVDPPDGAADRLSTGERRRIRRILEQEQAVLQLDREVERGDEAGVVAALHQVERTSARIPDQATWKSIRRVVERVTLIDELLEAAQQDPLDYAHVADLLQEVRALGLEQDPRLGRSDFVADLERQLLRMAHAKRIRAAIARGNDIAIVAAAIPDPYLAVDLLTAAERDRIALAIQARREVGVPYAPREKESDN